MKARDFRFLLALLGLVPIRSGILLLQDKDCGCFLIDKSLLHAHNVFFGSLSIVIGLGVITLVLAIL